MNRFRWACYAVGTALAAYGVFGLLTAARSNPAAWARFAAIVLIVNDGLLAPLILLAGVALARFVPAGARVYLQSGLVISGAVTMIAVPLLLGFGRSADLPSALPLNYGRGLAITLGTVWLGIGAVALIRRTRLGRASPYGPRTRRPDPRKPA